MTVFRKIRIELDNSSNHIFQPGEYVSGNVVYSSPTEDRLTNITITFRGVCKVKMPNPDYEAPLIRKIGVTDKIRKEHVELFHHQEVLLQQPTRFEKNLVHKWPFDFTFPYQTAPDKTGQYVSVQPNLFDESPHSLPPSIGPKQADEHTRIVYEMYCIAFRSSLDRRGGVYMCGEQTEPHSDSIELQLLPSILPSSIPPPVAKPYEMAFKVFPQQRKSSVLTLQSRRPSASLISETPITTTISVNVPQTIVLGKDLELSYTVSSNDSASPTSSTSTAYTHKSTSCTLIATTHRRCTKIPIDTPSLIETTSHTLRPESSKSHPLNPPASSYLRVFSTSPLKDFPPSFKSYSISRIFGLRIIVKVACAGQRQDFEASFDIPEVTVLRLGEGNTDGGPHGRLAELPPLLPPPGPEDEELPAYVR
ncbi:hypothetical protein MMC20_002608 [Loxospora ochrophaea]|nr:hypothetical protein [Loxospora ochrophaea]